MKRSEFFILGILLCFATILFSYNLAWGAPYFFHPDERNIANSASGLIFPAQLNPHFFAYGSLPIYVIYIIALIKNSFHFSFFISFADAIIASRIASNICAYGTVILLFFAGKKLYSVKAGILATFFGIFSVGFIQYAHFGTFEMWLTIFYLFLFYRFIFFLNNKNSRNFFFIVIISGILISIKISSLIFLLFPFLAFILLLSKKEERLFFGIRMLFTSFMILFSIFIFTNPFAFLDFSSFISSIYYESRVATGLPVFYTGGFLGTIPIIYQLFHVYPFLLNPIILLVGLFSFVKLSRRQYTAFFHRLILLFFCVYFLSQAFLFVKWTRYLIPSLPFIYLSISIFIMELKKYSFDTTLRKNLGNALIILCILSSIIWSNAYFITAFVQNDTRVTAMEWSKKHIPSTSHMLTEAYDIGTLPFQSYFSNITIFNFYDLDTTPSTQYDLQQVLEKSDFLLLPSQRIRKNRIVNPHSFPTGSTFYATLNKSNSFEKIYQTPCDIYCQITYLGDPIFRYEETTSVFDRPTIQIYQIHEK
jgi:4-amino-4-deoxy-L-arabinose transferase-like glycosyltransferase